MAGVPPIDSVHTIAEVLDEAIAQERFVSAISLVLAALVIAIGGVGLYALLSYEVAQRTHELGIRLALGATSRGVVALVLRDCAWLVVPALAIGLPLGRAASGALSSQLYDVQPGDPLTLASVALLLAAVALLATLRPAPGPRRASIRSRSCAPSNTRARMAFQPSHPGSWHPAPSTFAAQRLLHAHSGPIPAVEPFVVDRPWPRSPCRRERWQARSRVH
jgi:ABC-type antimicrobial peptide transport system permease subunit